MKLSIPDFPDYYITDDGVVWSHKYKLPRKLKLNPGKNGYITVSLQKGPKKHFLLVHRLVGLVFIPNPLNLPFVCHSDDNRSNNRKANLFWGTRQDNMDDMKTKGRQCNGSKTNTAKLTEQDVLDIRASADTPLVLSLRYNISRNSIYAILSRITWKHI